MPKDNDNPTPAVEVAQSPVRIALEYVSPTIAAAFEDNLCLIWSGEWQAYWREGGHGYTKLADQAGVFTILAAYARTQHCDPTKQIAFERVPTPSRGGEVEGLTSGEPVACRFDGVAYSYADLQIAQRAACAIVPLFGTGDHGEQEAAKAGKLWNDHTAVQGALRALHEARAALASPPPVEGEPLGAALRRIAEGNLGDAPWQANYTTIKRVAAEALAASSATHTGSVMEDGGDESDAIVERVTSAFRADLARIMAKAKPDYRDNLAVALFEARYGMTLHGWSDETQRYWLERADEALAASPAAPPGLTSGEVGA